MNRFAPSAPGRERLVLGTASWLLALCGAWLLVSAAADFNAGRRAESWPVVEGDITDVQIHQVLVGRFLPLQTRLQATYEYLVGPVRYRNSRVSFDGVVPEELEPALLAAGGRVAVHYNPGNPGESVLYPGPGMGLALYGGLGLFFLAVSAVVRRYLDALLPAHPPRRRKRKG